MTDLPDPADDVRVGIVTALPVERAALEVLVDGAADLSVKQDHHHYRLGWMPSSVAGRPHRVAIGMPTWDGTSSAAAIAAEMLRSFPNLDVLIVCGIAGGVPRDEAAERPVGVRLGDVVVGSAGVVDFRHVRQVDGVSTPRRTVTGLSAELLRADREVQAAAVLGDEPWRAVLDRAQRRYPQFLRPGVLADPRYRPGEQLAAAPAVLRGVIASGDVLVRDAVFRDEAARRHGALAFEMETIGVAAAAGERGKHWFVVRSASDYCENDTKDDRWHAYAALAAAAYVRGLLAVCPPFGEPTTPPSSAPVSAPVPVSAAGRAGQSGLAAVVDALLRIPELVDDYQRRTVLEQLPVEMRAQITDNTRARIHLVGIVNSLDRQPGGRDALLAALATALGEQSARYRALAAVFAEHWPRS